MFRRFLLGALLFQVFWFGALIGKGVFGGAEPPASEDPNPKSEIRNSKSSTPVPVPKGSALQGDFTRGAAGGYRGRLYEVPGTRSSAADFFRRALPEAGFEAKEGWEDESRRAGGPWVLAFKKGPELVIVSLEKEHDGKTPVTILQGRPSLTALPGDAASKEQ